MVKGSNKEDMIRIVESENSTIIIIYHPPSRILFCSISDSDSDLKIFRTTSQKSRFQTIIADIENLSRGGKIAEIFPKLLVVKKVLSKIMSMGMINEEDFQVALRCTGEASPLKIARELAKTRNDVNNVLKKLEQLDIVNF